MEINKKEYGAYVKEITPVHSTLKNVCAAFVSGGAICVLGQGLINGFKMNGMEQDAASAWTLMCLIFLSVLVPITGFANSVASPALEYKAEGQVFGIGCKIFTIAGPVILYGILASWVLGVIYWIWGVMGVI